MVFGKGQIEPPRPKVLAHIEPKDIDDAVRECGVAELPLASDDRLDSATLSALTNRCHELLQAHACGPDGAVHEQREPLIAFFGWWRRHVGKRMQKFSTKCRQGC